MDNLITVDIADLKVAKSPDILVTYALGSCIAVIAFDPESKVGGMIHYMLPLSKSSPDKAVNNPAMFADTGIPLLFNKMYEMGANKDTMVVKVTGGGSLYDDKGMFNIGKRNYTVLRKLFWKNKVIIAGEDVGGSKSRTARLYLKTGRAVVRSGKEEIEI